VLAASAHEEAAGSVEQALPARMENQTVRIEGRHRKMAGAYDPRRKHVDRPLGQTNLDHGSEGMVGSSHCESVAVQEIEPALGLHILHLEPVLDAWVAPAILSPLAPDALLVHRLRRTHLRHPNRRHRRRSIWPPPIALSWLD